LHAACGGVDLWLGNWIRRHSVGASLAGGGFIGPGLRADKRLAVVTALLAHGADVNGRITASAMLMSYIGWPKKGAFEPFACGTGDLRGATPLWVAAFAANGVGYVSMGAADDEILRARSGRRGGSPISIEVVRTLLAAGADPR